MARIAFALLILAGLLSIGAGVRYLTASEFMPYHAVVAGQSWASLPAGLQTVILGMLRILAGGFLACGLSLLGFAWAARTGLRWAYVASLLVGVAVWLPTLLVTLMLVSAQPAASPPMVPSALILGLVVVGSLSGLTARTKFPRRD